MHHFTLQWVYPLRSVGPLWPASQQPYAAYTAICCICSPCAAQMQCTGSQMHPRRCPISARMLPCGQPNNTICNVFCNMLHMPPLCSQMQPTRNQIHPPGWTWSNLVSHVLSWSHVVSHGLTLSLCVPCLTGSHSAFTSLHFDLTLVLP